MLFPIVELFRRWIDTRRFPREELALSPKRVLLLLAALWLAFMTLLLVVSLVANAL
jgi:hypothetical protein